MARCGGILLCYNCVKNSSGQVGRSLATNGGIVKCESETSVSGSSYLTILFYSLNIGLYAIMVTCSSDDKQVLSGCRV